MDHFLSFETNSQTLTVGAAQPLTATSSFNIKFDNSQDIYFMGMDGAFAAEGALNAMNFFGMSEA